MVRESLSERFVEFIRSVIPADPAQLLFLAGVVCLVVAPRMGWVPTNLRVSSDYAENLRIQQTLVETRPVITLALLPIVLAGMAGYFVCFWPGSKPVWRVLRWVILPATAGLGLIFSCFLYVNKPFISTLDTRSILLHAIRWVQSTLWMFTPGFRFALIGLSLIVIFTWRLACGLVSLPLALPGAGVTKSEDSKSWQRVQFLTWAVEGPLFLLDGLLGFIIAIPYIFFAQRPSFIQSTWFSRSSSVLDSLILTTIALWIVGGTGIYVAKNATRMSQPNYVLLALAFSIGIELVLSTGHYLVDRTLWSASKFGNHMPPDFRSYFNFPSPWLLLLFFSALSEEFIFRGLLQSSFVQRYGLHRGIFLSGIVWAAYHFRTDVSSSLAEEGVLLQFGFRVFMCLALSFVLGWLVLRSGSLLPAAIAHTFYNVLVFGGFGLQFEGKPTIRVALWGALALLLFRYWPVQVGAASEDATAGTSPEPAV